MSSVKRYVTGVRGPARDGVTSSGQGYRWSSLVTVTGIVPDTVTAVSVVLGNGSVKELKPTNNAYLGRLTTADQPTTIVYHAADGTREFPLLLPDLAAITKRELQRSAATR